jgi:hypothetical protein
VLNNMEFKTEAMIKRYFGTNRYYYDYRYSKGHPEPGIGGKFLALMTDMKLFLGKLRPGKKKDR